ncbi:MAG TPA: hypothetical protein VMU80_06515 [Bryobacteraceae bacterium]|nr:hypothetical protein [Bryobacteraceae bacterium]
MMPSNVRSTPKGNLLFSVVDDGVGVQDEPFKDKRLIKKSNQYQVVTYGHKTGKYDAALVGTPKGVYDFVVLPAFPDVCYVRRNRGDRDLKYRDNPGHHDLKVNRGHMSIARGGEVFFAGSIWFGGGPTTGKFPEGQLLQWENSSGHYKIGLGKRGQDLLDLVKRQTRFLKCTDGSLLLPIEKFKPWNGDPV